MRKSNRKVMAGIAVMTLAAACMVTGCGKKDEKKEDKDLSVTQAAENTADSTEAPTEEAPADTTTYENTALGIKMDFGTYASTIITTEGTEIQNDALQAKDLTLNLSAELKGVSLNCATIHVFDRAFDEAELEEIDPTMGYLGQSGNTTYTISYVEECPEQEDEEVKTQWNDLMNNCISKLKDNITLTGLPQ